MSSPQVDSGKQLLRSDDLDSSFLGKRLAPGQALSSVMSSNKRLKRFGISTGDSEASVRTTMENSNDDDNDNDQNNNGLDPIAFASTEESKRERERKKNALYSRRKRQRKKEFVQELQKNKVSLQEENDQAKETKQTLEDLLSQAKSMVTVYEAGRASGRGKDEEQTNVQRRHEMPEQLVQPCYEHAQQQQLKIPIGPRTVPAFRGTMSASAFLGHLQHPVSNGHSTVSLSSDLALRASRRLSASHRLGTAQSEKAAATDVDRIARDLFLQRLLLEQRLSSLPTTNAVASVMPFSAGARYM